MIEVRFSTWIKAESLEDAWEQLRVKLIEVRLGDRIREVFTPAVLEDGEQDKKELAPLTLEERKKMKGWIKVRELNSYERYIRTSDIEQIAIPDKGEGSYLFTLRGSLVRVRETPDEVMKMIEEVEKPWYVKAKEECEKRKGECHSCPFTDFCLPPTMWESNPIPEEYR